MERLTPSEWQRSHHSVTLASCCLQRAAPSEGAAAVGRILPWLQSSADQAQITRVAPLYSFKPQLSWIPKHVLSVYGLCNLEPILTFILGCKELLCQLVLNWAGLRGSFFNVVPYYWPFWCYPLLWCNYCLRWSTHGQSSAVILADFFVNLSSYLGSFFFFYLEEEGTHKKKKMEGWKLLGFGKKYFWQWNEQKGFEQHGSPAKPGNKTAPSSETLPSFNYTGDISDTESDFFFLHLHIENTLLKILKKK